MLSAKLVPTALIDPGTIPPIKIAPQARIRRASSLRLFFRLIGFAMAYGWARRVRRRSDAELALRVRDLLEGLGGLWIKAGQLLSLRVDLLSREMADQLSQLQYQSYGFDPAVAQEIVERELGRPTAEVFEAFETHPFAAASISQLHRARLLGSGDYVAVKIQRPGMEDALRRDLGLITWLLRRMRHLPKVSYIGWDGMIRELERMLQEEVDYRYEVANLRRMRKILRKHKVHVPKPYRALCTHRVIVMEYVPGVVMSDYLRAQRSDPARLRDWERQNGVEPSKVGKRLLLSFYRQLFEEKIFHGDLHPGNIMLLRNNRIALIDLGTVGSLERNFLRVYGQMAAAIAHGDYAKAMDLYLLLCDSIPPIDMHAYRAEAVEVTRAWEARTHLDGLTYLQKSITGGLSVDLARILRTYRVSPSWQFLRVTRSVGAMDANLNVLLERESSARLLRMYFRQARRRSMRRFRRHGATTVLNTLTAATETGGNLAELVRRQAIRLQGTQSKMAQVLATIVAFLQVGVLLLAIVLIYDFMHDHYHNLVALFDGSVGGMDDFSQWLPTIPYVINLAIIVAVVALFFVLGHIRRILSRPSVRLPTGRVDG